MAGRLYNDFRSGNINEEIGILLLKGLCAVADVPRPEDVGIDAVCTLLRESGDSLIAEDSFYVQFKSASIDPLEYESHEIEWLKNLELPYFVGRVDPETSTISLHPMHCLNNIFTTHKDSGALVFFEKDPDKSKRQVRRIPAGPPLLRWSFSEFRDSTFASAAYILLKEYIQHEKRNIGFRKFQYIEIIRWEENGPIESRGSLHVHSTLDCTNEIDVLNAMDPLIKMLASQALSQQSRERFEAIVAFIAYMRERGVDPDPKRIFDSFLNQWDGLMSARGGVAISGNGTAVVPSDPIV